MKCMDKRRPGNSVKRCAFTGYRPAKLPFGYDEEGPLAQDFKKRLHETLVVLIPQGYRHMISGGAQGMDLIAAEMVLELKEEFPDVTLEMALPYEGQASRWTDDYQRRWHRCVQEADMVTVISDSFTKGCFFQRNRYMVLQADILVACYDGQEGGTKMTVDYARQCGCPVCLLPPVKVAQTA